MLEIEKKMVEGTKGLEWMCPQPGQYPTITRANTTPAL